MNRRQFFELGLTALGALVCGKRVTEQAQAIQPFDPGSWYLCDGQWLARQRVIDPGWQLQPIRDPGHQHTLYWHNTGLNIWQNQG